MDIYRAEFQIYFDLKLMPDIEPRALVICAYLIRSALGNVTNSMHH